MTLALNRATGKAFIFTGCLISMLISLTGCEQKQEKRIMPLPCVSVYDVQTEPVGQHQEYVARTEAVNTVNLTARVEGYLTSRNFEEGQVVKKGQLLFGIDRKPYEAALAKSEADLASSRAELGKSLKDLKRSQDLFKKGYISRAELDTQESKAAVAEASVKVAVAGLDTARLNLGYTKITAPFTGQIGRSNYSVGSLVGPTVGALGVLTSVDPIYVTFQVGEKQFLDYVQQMKGERGADAVNKNYVMSLRLPNSQLYGQKGVFNFVDTSVDPSTSTLTVRAEFPNPKGTIVPGLYVTLLADSRRKKEQLVIPQFAVQENQLGRFVLVVNAENQAETRQVELGQRIGPMWVVSSGLKAGEKIIVEGLQKVRPKAKVRPLTVKVDSETGAIEAPPKQANSGKQQQGR